MAQLGRYECFGEDYNNVSNLLMQAPQLRNQPICYSVISTMPTQCFCVKKYDFYSYINDKTRKIFMMNMKQYPTNEELRSNYFNKDHWS